MVDDFGRVIHPAIVIASGVQAYHATKEHLHAFPDALQALDELRHTDLTRGVISNGLDLFWRIRSYQQQGYAYQPGPSLAALLGSLFLTVAGLYLLFRGAVVLDAVFHESLGDGSREDGDRDGDTDERAESAP